MSDNLAWQQRDARPKVTVAAGEWSGPSGQGVWVSREIDEFLYHDRPNHLMEELPYDLAHGVGIMRDTFEPSHERPNVGFLTLVKQGYRKWHKYLPRE